MSIDEYLIDTIFDAPCQPDTKQRNTADRHKALWNRVCQRAQSRAVASRQKKAFHFNLA
jgi:hypothetical protein